MRRLGELGLATVGVGAGTAASALLRVTIPNPWIRFGVTAAGALAAAYLAPGDFLRAGLSGALGASSAVDLLHGFKRAPYETAPRDVFRPIEGSVAATMPQGPALRTAR